MLRILPVFPCMCDGLPDLNVWIKSSCQNCSFFYELTNRQPPKKPRDGDLTATQKRRRKQISRVRVRVEHHIGRLKRYGILTMPFGGTAKDLNYFMQIITGLENLKTMLKRKKYYGQLLQQLHLLPDT